MIEASTTRRFFSPRTLNPTNTARTLITNYNYSYLLGLCRANRAVGLSQQKKIKYLNTEMHKYAVIRGYSTVARIFVFPKINRFCFLNYRIKIYRISKWRGLSRRTHL